MCPDSANGRASASGAGGCGFDPGPKIRVEQFLGKSPTDGVRTKSKWNAG